MKLTNQHNLPESFVKFIRNEKYSRGESDISVTTLIDSPRINKLRQENYDSMTMDVSDRIPSLFGTAVHQVLQEIDSEPSFVVEERLFAEKFGWTFSGAIDVQEYLPDGTIRIQDYKVCSVWAVLNEKPEWEKQLNMYAYLVRMNKDVEVSSLQIVAILRDWSRRKAMMEADYPKSNAVVVDVPLWDLERQEYYVAERVAMHKNAQEQIDYIDTLVRCSDQERWAKPTRYAVMKKGRKSAVKLFDSFAEADLFKKDQQKKTANAEFYVDTRQGEYTRCEGNFCGVAEFCDQYKGDL